MSAEQPRPEPGGPCPKCEGSGGHVADAVPQWMGEWVDCKACDGSGEYWPEEEPSLNSERRGALNLAAVLAGDACPGCGMRPSACHDGDARGCHSAVPS